MRYREIFQGPCMNMAMVAHITNKFHCIANANCTEKNKNITQSHTRTSKYINTQRDICVCAAVR